MIDSIGFLSTRFTFVIHCGSPIQLKRFWDFTFFFLLEDFVTVTSTFQESMKHFHTPTTKKKLLG